jgi:hypothetical protein
MRGVPSSAQSGALSQKDATRREQGAVAEVPRLRLAMSGHARERYDRRAGANRPATRASPSLQDGTCLVVIPQLAATSPNTGQDPVAVIRLPADFDKFEPGKLDAAKSETSGTTR